MAYVYRNVKTNETITTTNKVRGKNWEEVKKTDPKKTDPKKTDPKKTDPKKTDPKKTDPKKGAEDK